MKFKSILENLLSDILLEYEILPYKEVRNEGSRLDYSFNVGDIEYVVTLLGTDDKQLYELGLGLLARKTWHIELAKTYSI